MATLNDKLREIATVDLATYCAFICKLVSVDGGQRGEVEALLDAFGRHHPDAFVGRLLEVLGKGGEAESRTIAATLLRKVVPTGNPPMWANLEQATQANLKSATLSILASEPQRDVRSKVGNLVSELVTKVLGVEDWPEVLPFITQSIQSGNEGLAETGLLILSDIAPVITEVVKSDIDKFGQLLMGCLGSPLPLIRLGGLKAAKAAILALEDEADVAKFKLIVPVMIGAVSSMPVDSGEELAVQAYATVIEMVDELPSFFQEHLPNIVGQMLEHARSMNLPMGVRNMAVELLIVLIEMSKLEGEIPQVLQALVPELIKVLMDCMLDIQDVPSWAESQTGEYDDEEAFSDSFSIGQTGVDRVACAAGGGLLFPILQQIIPAWTSDQDWRKRHAAIILLGQIAEGCSEAMSSDTKSSFGCCLQALNDTHRRVKWASCQAIGLLMPEIGSATEEAQLISIVDALVILAKDKSNDRIRQHSIRALINVCGQGEFELYGTSLQSAIGTILEALKDGTTGTQNVALSCLAELSQACPPGDFHYYYEDTMKVLHGMMAQRAAVKSSTLPVARILETIGKIGVASGRMVFLGDCQQVMAYIEEVLRVTVALPEDDEERKESLSLLFGAAEMVSKTQRGHFANHVAQFVPPIVSVLTSQLQVQICDAADWDEGMDVGTETIEVAGKILSVDTDALEHKAVALQTIIGFAESLEEHFPIPHITQLMEATGQLLGSALTKDVQELAINAQPALLKCCAAAAKKNMNVPQGFVPTALNIQWQLLLDQLTQLDNAISVRTIPAVMGALAQIVLTVEGGLTEDKVQEAFAKVYNAVEHFKSQHGDMEDIVGEADLTPDDLEEIADEIQLQTELYDKLEDLLSAFLRLYGDKCLPFVDTLMPKLSAELSSKRSSEIKQMVVILMTDIVEYSPAAATKYLSIIMPAFLEGSGSDHPGLRHCSCFGIGVIGQKVPQGFRPYAQQAVSHLMNAMNRDDAQVDDFMSATDNAVSALGKIFEAHGDLMDVKLLVTTWLRFLPLQNDKVEAMTAHEQLVRLVEKMDVAVLGDSNQNAGQLVRVMVAVLSKGDRLISKEAGAKMVNVLRHLEGVVPKEVVNEAMQNMADCDKENLQAFAAGRFA